jgi:ribosomal protein S18 acetylase RimI-like enzyme
MINIIKYNGNKINIVGLIEELQDYLIEIDPLKRLTRLPKYGEVYIDNLLEKIKNQDGVIYIAEIDNMPVGMIAGVFEEQTDLDKLECIPSKPARILELIVNEKYRNQSIGSLLMNKIEEHFKEKGADIIRVEVFEPNKNTHNFYSKSGYEDRSIDMVKKIIV